MRTSYVVGVVVLVLVVAVALYLALQPTAPPPAAQTPTTAPPTTPRPATQTPTPVTTAPPTGPIVMCIIYDPRIPVLKAEAEAVKLAVREINSGGGIAGRQVVLLEEDHQRKADLAVAAYRRLVLERGCKYVMTDSISEIALAVMESAVAIYPTYPHVVLVPGQASMETTLRVINEYDKYKFYFRPFITDPGITYNISIAYFDIAKNIIGAKRIALFIDDALWTLCAREGCTYRTAFGDYSFRPLREVAREFGLEVVYEVKLAIGEKNFVPMLEEAARRGAEAIFALIWHTDSVTLTKQWAASAARDIPLMMTGGPAQWRVFWNMTGGDALGVISIFTEDPQHPLMRARDAITKLLSAGARVDFVLLYYYSMPYLLKEAIEKVGNPNDMEGVIKALENIKFDKHTILSPDQAYLGRRDLLFHSYPTLPPFLAQFQCNGKAIFIGRPEFYRKYYAESEVNWGVLKPGGYKPPAQLRAECPK